MIVPDVNLLVYAYDRRSPQHRRAKAWWEQTLSGVGAWLAVPIARLLAPGPGTFATFFDLLAAADTGGNLTTDAMIAAHALEHGARVYSNDRDFARFSRVAWHNPLA